MGYWGIKMISILESYKLASQLPKLRVAGSNLVARFQTTKQFNYIADSIERARKYFQANLGKSCAWKILRVRELFGKSVNRGVYAV